MKIIIWAKRVIGQLYFQLAPVRFKEANELAYWKDKAKAQNGVLSNTHYGYFYTDFFGFNREFYKGKKILDVGCGPRGSLEWADAAAERVGLDPLVHKYLALGASRHKMKYVDAPSEDMPFPDEYFDCAFSFNSLDHVRDADQTIREIKRVLKTGGIFLLIVEVNHPPTPTEPITFGWDIASRFADKFALRDFRKYEIGDHDIYGQLEQNARYDDENPSTRAGIAAAAFIKARS